MWVELQSPCNGIPPLLLGRFDISGWGLQVTATAFRKGLEQFARSQVSGQTVCRGLHHVKYESTQVSMHEPDTGLISWEAKDRVY